MVKQVRFGLLAFGLLCAALTSSAGAQQPTRLGGEPAGVERLFASEREILAWISAYRDDPKAELVPHAVQAMSRLGLVRDLERAGVYLGFVAGVLGANQTRADELLSASFPLDPQDQVIIIRAIADSGLPEWQALLGRFTERMPARQILIRAYLDGKQKPLQDTPLDKGPQVLDAWWGQYFATGRYDPILRIIPGLAWVNEKRDLERLTIGGMATWTLATNASRDKALLDFLRAEIYRQPKPIAAELRKVVSAAETYEVAGLRTEALRRIDIRKAQGPPKARGWAWWTDAAGTAIALGCVVAGATGQLALGLPCIIGGALTTATSRALRLDEANRSTAGQ